MVKVRKIKTDSPATTLGILAFNLDTGAPKIMPHEFLIIVGLFIVVEIALMVFFPV